MPYGQEHMLIDHRYKIREIDLQDYRLLVVKIVFLLTVGAVVTFVCSFVV